MKKFIAGCVAVIVLFVALIGWHIHANYNEHTCIIEVTDKERVDYDKNGKYLIFGRTDNNTLVLENTDSLLRGKFNSSDIYAELEVGKIYECYTTNRKRFLEPKRNTIQSKIIDICAEFGCYTNPWYSGYQEISLELHGDNVEFMLNELRKY